MTINSLSSEQTNTHFKEPSNISVKLQEETRRAPEISDFDAVVTRPDERSNAALHEKSPESEKTPSKNENTQSLPTLADVIKRIMDGTIRSMIMNTPKPDLDSE